MQFSLIALVAAFAGVAMATPMTLHQIRACNVAACTLALGPTAFSCTGAALEAGANPLADAGCIADVLNDVVNPPAACAGCGSRINKAVTSAELPVANAMTNVTSAIGSLL